MYAAEHHARTSLARTLPDLVATKRVAGMNTDPNNVTGLYAVHIERFQGLVDDLRPTIHGRCRSR
jgi:hypothetical protein